MPLLPLCVQKPFNANAVRCKPSTFGIILISPGWTSRRNFRCLPPLDWPTREEIWKHLFLTKQRQNPFVEGRYTGADYEDVERKWEAKKLYFLDYKKDGTRPPSIDLAMALHGFGIDNTAAQNAIEGSKALHARRWQTKDGTYRLKRHALPDVRDAPLDYDNAAASSTCRCQSTMAELGWGLCYGILTSSLTELDTRYSFASWWSSTHECFGRFTFFSPYVSPSPDTCRRSFFVWLLVFGLLGFWCLFPVLQVSRDFTIPPRVLDPDDRQGFAARSALRQKKNSDPFTAATTAWLREVLDQRHGDGCLNVPEWRTLIAFGKLRQHCAVTLLLPSHSNYLGFHSLAEPGQMGSFIAAQDAIVWAQQITQEISKLAGTNSTKAGMCLANLWCHFSDTTLFMKLQTAKDYYGMVNVLQELPGHGPFIAKNIVETVLNALHLSGVATADIGPNLKAVMRDYLADPVAVLGPGPLALGKFFSLTRRLVLPPEAWRVLKCKLCGASWKEPLTTTAHKLWATISGDHEGSCSHLLPVAPRNG